MAVCEKFLGDNEHHGTTMWPGFREKVLALVISLFSLSLETQQLDASPTPWDWHTGAVDHECHHTPFPPHLGTRKVLGLPMSLH